MPYWPQRPGRKAPRVTALRKDSRDPDAQALVTYLRQLFAAPVPGLDNGGLHLASGSHHAAQRGTG